MKTVYIIGSKGIPAKYGGFETFVEKLTENQKNKNIKYFVACTRENSKKSNISEDFFEYNGATCFSIDVPNIGPAKAIAYDIAALKKAIELAKTNNDREPIFYVLACRIGLFISKYRKFIHQIGGQLFVNLNRECEINWTARNNSDFVRVYAADLFAPTCLSLFVLASVHQEIMASSRSILYLLYESL